MTRNTRIFLILEAFLALGTGFILPIYVLYFRYFGITLLQVALLAAVFEASVLLFEIPTGLLADRFGQKLSVQTGFASFIASGLVFTLFRSFEGFLAAEVLFGLAEACISGASEALAVDSIPECERETRFPRLYTWRSRVRIGISAIAMITAGMLFAKNALVTFYPIIIGGIAGLAISFQYVPTRSDAPDTPRLKLLEPLKKLFGQVHTSSILKAIFIVSLIANLSFEGADQYWQVLGSELYDLDVSLFGILTAAGAVLAFLLVGPLVKRFSGTISPSFMILLLAGVAISSLPNLPGLFLPYVLVIYFICREIVKPFFSITINSVAESSGRATFLSGYNLTCSIGEVGSGVLVGLIASRLGLPVVFVLCGGILVLAIPAIVFRYRQAIEVSRE